MTAAALVLLAAAIGAASIVLFAWGWVLVKTDPPVPRYLIAQRRRRRAPLPKDQSGPLSGLLDAVGRPFAGMLVTMLGEDQLNRARHRIAAAGKSSAMTTDGYARRRAGSIVITLVLGVMLCVLEYWGSGLALIALGQVWVDLHLWLLARKRAEEIERQLPDFLDVLAVTVSAGLGFKHALTRVTESTPGALSEEFNLALHQMELGTSRRDAFRQLRGRTNSTTLNQFLTAVLQAEELGSALSDALVGIANDMRQNTAQLARRRAARIAPRIQLIVAFVLVPGALLLFFGTLLLSLSDNGGLIGVLG